ncbi:DUF2188 domain-containing protein [Streptomyces sp. H27-G5]|uniref:DUF2188 domain-containing protein n=1 Tax=Streptomyces sp. H27-G5 TaxID=2996698 RepID=UPI003B63FF68
MHEPHQTQKDAIDAARRANADQPSQFVVHARDGHIRTAYTDGDSPLRHPPASAAARQGNPEASSRTGPGGGLKRWCGRGFVKARGFSMLEGRSPGSVAVGSSCLPVGPVERSGMNHPRGG